MRIMSSIAVSMTLVNEINSCFCVFCGNSWNATCGSAIVVLAVAVAVAMAVAVLTIAVPITSGTSSCEKGGEYEFHF